MGYVHLYILATHGLVTPVELPELPVVAVRLQLRSARLDIIAMHLEPCAEGESVRSDQIRMAVRIVRAAATGSVSGQPAGLVVLGDLNVRQMEFEE